LKKAFLLIIALALLCSCSTQKSAYPTDNTFHAGTDYQYNMFASTNVYCMADAGEGFYFWVPMCLLYIDKATLAPIPVCNKPNCQHYNEADSERFALCNAFIPPTTNKISLFWNDNNLYAIQRSELSGKRQEIIRISADGSRREKLHSLGKVAVISGVVVHRGYMYIALTSYDENTSVSCGLWAYSLTNPNEKPRLLLELEGRGNHSVVGNMTAYGNQLYFYIIKNDQFDDTVFVSYDILTDELHEIMTTDDGYKTSLVTFVKDKMVLVRVNTTTETLGTPVPYEQQLWLCDLDGGNPRMLSTDYGIIATDGEYIYRGADYWIPNNPDHYLHIYDADYNELDKIDLNELPGVTDPRMFAYYPTMGDRVLFMENGLRSGRSYMFWFDKSQIGSGAIEVHPVMDFEDEYRGVFAHGGTLKIK
jgi:hypothetical protein